MPPDPRPLPRPVGPTRRRLLRSGLGLCALAAAAGLPAERAGAAESAESAEAAAPTRPPLPPLRPVAVAPDVWFVQGEAALGSARNANFISNAGFVVTPAGVVVVDALGSPALAQQLLVEIARITPQPVTHVVLTHYHADHIYGLQVLQAAGAQVLAHAAGRDYLQSDTARLRLQASRADIAPWIDADTRLVPADRWLDADGSHAPVRLVVGGVELVIQPVGPSHTAEDLVVQVPSRGVVFAGDLMFRGRIPFVGQADSRGWIRALDRVLAMRPAVLLPGHGPASTEPLADLAMTRDYLQYLRATMGPAAQAMEPFDEAYARTDWSRFERWPLFQAANRMNAYNTYLLMEQEKP